MDNKQFEQQVRNKLLGFSANPPDQVWLDINRRLNAKRKKRRMIFWLLPLSILSAVISNRFMPDSRQESLQTSTQTTEINGGKQNLPQTTDAANIAPNLPASNEHKSIKPQEFVNTNSSMAINAQKPSRITFNEFEAKDVAALQLQQEKLIDHPTEDYTNIVDSRKQEEVEPLPVREIAQLKKIAASPELAQDTIIVVACAPQKNKTRKSLSWHYSGAYSFHGTGDLEGMQLEWGLSKPINRYFSFYNNIGVSLHGGSVVQPLNLNILVAPSAALPIGQGSVYEITSAIQTAPTLLGAVPFTPLRIGVGGLLRYQFYSGGSGYGVQRNQNMQTFTLRDGNFNGLSLGYRVIVGLELLNTKRNKLQFQAGFQNDTRGDVITGLGLSWQHLKK
jgi:hypothetical protein